MQDCFRQHPEMYGSELEDDEDELEEELRADEAARASQSSAQEPSPVPGQSHSSPNTAPRETQEPKLVQDSATSGGKPAISGDEGGELTPKDLQRTPSK
jgi:intermembrane space import and assembly protein 40